MKAFNITFLILFVLFAALQYNDPDPFVWIPIYLYGALLCYLATRGQYLRGMYIAGLLVYAGYAAFLLFDKNGVINWAGSHQAENLVHTMKAEKPWIEETREFGGLLILIIVLLVNMRWLSKTRMVHAYNLE